MQTFKRLLEEEKLHLLKKILHPKFTNTSKNNYAHFHQMKNLKAQL